jgi:hypothetical protein
VLFQPGSLVEGVGQETNTGDRASIISKVSAGSNSTGLLNSSVILFFVFVSLNLLRRFASHLDGSLRNLSRHLLSYIFALMHFLRRSATPRKKRGRRHFWKARSNFAIIGVYSKENFQVAHHERFSISPKTF